MIAEPVAREAPPPRRSERLCNSREILLLDNDTREILLLDNDEPTTYVEAMMDPDSKKWQSAMRSKIESMSDTRVWNLVDLPDGHKTIECKWIYKRKIDNLIWMEMFMSIKLDLSQKVFSKFKELTMTRL